MLARRQLIDKAAKQYHAACVSEAILMPCPSQSQQPFIEHKDAAAERTINSSVHLF